MTGLFGSVSPSHRMFDILLNINYL
jgi:hypothetical protein